MLCLHLQKLYKQPLLIKYIICIQSTFIYFDMQQLKDRIVHNLQSCMNWNNFWASMLEA